MRRKLRIFSHIAIICLSVCMFAFGVYAANQVSVTTSGTVTFEATGVHANLSREIYYHDASASTIKTFNPVTIDASTAETLPAITGETIAFEKGDKPVVISFRVENLATDRNLAIEVYDDETETPVGITKEVRIDGKEYELGTKYQVAPQHEEFDNTSLITIVFRATETNTSSSANYNYRIKLSTPETVLPADFMPTTNDTYASIKKVAQVGNTVLVKADISKATGTEFYGWSRTAGGEIISTNLYDQFTLSEANETLYANVACPEQSSTIWPQSTPNGNIIVATYEGSSVSTLSNFAYYNYQQDSYKETHIDRLITIDKTFSQYANLIITNANGDKYLKVGTNNHFALLSVGNASATTFTFEEGCEIIAEGAFDNCNNITNLYIPEGISRVGSLPANLTEVYLPTTLVYLGSDVNLINIANKVTYGNAYYVGNEFNPYTVMVGVVDKTNGNLTTHEDCRVIATNATQGYTSYTHKTFNITENVVYMGIETVTSENEDAILLPTINSKNLFVAGTCYSYTEINLMIPSVSVMELNLKFILNFSTGTLYMPVEVENEILEKYELSELNIATTEAYYEKQDGTFIQDGVECYKYINYGK